MERRELIKWMVATGGLAAFNRLSERDLIDLGTRAHGQPSARFRSLSAAQAREITVVAEHIIPASDTPGATDANVTAFIDTMMSDWYTPAEREQFLSGLGELDTKAHARHGKTFGACAATEQVAMLQTLDDEVVALRRARGAAANEHWFATLKYLTVWGYCTSEPAMRKTFKSHPLPMRYDGNASVRS